MKKNKKHWIVLGLGIFFISLALIGLLINLNTSPSQTQYEIGSVLKIEGNLKKIVDGKELKSFPFQKIYSKEGFNLQKDSKLQIKLANEKITIVGPASFRFEVFSPEKQRVFINFDEFTAIENKDELQNIILTYKGWGIQPYFTNDDLDTNNQSLNIEPGLNLNEDGDTASGNLEEPTETSEDKSQILDELIGAKRSLLKKCYKNYLRENPMAKGNLIVEFNLQNNGKVSSTKIKDSTFLNDVSFKKCIQDVFSRIKTDPFSGNTIMVSYPIEFE